MSRPIRIGESAAAEFAEAVRWHEGRRRGLGSELHELVITVLGLIADHPELGSPIRRTKDPIVRRHLIARFPYQIIYYARADEIAVVAIAHTSRRPNYWRNRLTTEAT